MEKHHYDYLYSVLRTAQNSRGYFPGIEWIEYEKLTMLQAVNRLISVETRFSLNEPPKVTLEQIEFAEGRAAGHIDYTRKFVLYCTELVQQNIVLTSTTN